MISNLFLFIQINTYTNSNPNLKSKFKPIPKLIPKHNPNIIIIVYVFNVNKKKCNAFIK